MFFKNLTLFRFPASLDLSDLDEQLAPHLLKPVGALELSSHGFISPFGREALKSRRPKAAAPAGRHASG